MTTVTMLVVSSKSGSHQLQQDRRVIKRSQAAGSRQMDTALKISGV